MKCIFCKEISDDSFSIEHILPESLGNKKATLFSGIVCDKCNNYFGRKIENPVLSSGIFRLLRDDRKVPSKNGRIPTFGKEEIASLPDYRVMGRFIGKVGIEALAQRISSVENWNKEIVNKKELDELREFVRFNVGKNDWPFAFRRLYPVNTAFPEDGRFYEVLNEYDLLYTEGNELFIVLVLFGVEFALNMGGPVLDGYRSWLKVNNWVSPLYIGKNL